MKTKRKERQEIWKDRSPGEALPGSTGYILEIKDAEIKKIIKETVFFKDGIKGTILCFDGEFLEIIKRHIPVFFLLNNFGTGQNKGFGSFSVAGGKAGGSIYDVIRKYEQNAFYLDYRELGRRMDIPAEKRLDDIGILYDLMKGGINNTGKRDEQYYKSAIFRYYLEKGIINEKKVIKQYLFDKKV